MSQAWKNSAISRDSGADPEMKNRSRPPKRSRMVLSTSLSASLYCAASNADGRSPDCLARDTCNRCTVTNDCLTYAIDTAQPYGAWGGIPARQRRLGGAA